MLSLMLSIKHNYSKLAAFWDATIVSAINLKTWHLNVIYKASLNTI